MLNVLTSTVGRAAHAAVVTALSISICWIAVAGTAFAANCVSNGTAPQNWNNTATWSCGVTPGVADNVTIQNGHTIVMNGDRQVQNLTINTGGLLTFANTNDLTVQNNGAVAINGGITGVATSTITKNGTGAISGTGTVSGLTTFTIAGNTSISAGTNLTLTGTTIAIAAAVTVTNNGAIDAITITGANATTSIWTNAANSTLRVSGALLATGVLNANASPNTVNYDGAAQTVKLPSGAPARYHHLILSGSGTKTMPATAMTIGGDFMMSGTAAATAAQVLTITGDTNIGVGTAFNASTFTHPFSGDLVVNGTISGTGQITLNGTGTTIDGTGSITGTGVLAMTTGAKSILSTANLSVAWAIPITGAIVVTNNGIITSTSATGITGSVAGSTWTNAASSTLNVSGPLLATGTLNASATNNTVNYAGAAQTVKVPSANDYYHLTLSGSSNKDPVTASTYDVLGNFTVSTGVTWRGTQPATDPDMNIDGNLLNNGTLITGNGDYTLGGNFTNNSTFTAGTGAFTFDGTGAQTIGGTAATTFANVTFDKTSGTMTLNSNVTVSAQLALTNGIVATGATTLTMTSSCVTNVLRTNGHVAGNLRLRFPTGSPTCVFPVGDAGSLPGAAYTPISAAVGSVTVTGDLIAKVTNSEHPNIASSQLDATNSANRYWTITDPGAITFATASLTFTFVSADVDAGADPLNFFVGNFAGAVWTYPSVGTVSSTSIQAQAIADAAIAGDYAIGEMGGPFSYWRMNENAWNGTASEVADFGSASNPGTASNISGTKPTTSFTTPAIAGTPGTCRYGVFNRANKDYLALPGGYPNLMAAGSPGFSITAWIRTTDSTLPGQRIFIDDEGNATPGGWGFSVGETDRAGTGGLRFYYRQAATFTLDTVAIPSNQWLFVALSVSLATGTGASRGTLYAYNTAGTLVTTYTDVFTWTPGSDAGPSSIGGETNAAGEGNNQFGFAGNIDELRVYRAALNQTMINQVRQLVNPCILTDHYAIVGSTTGVNCEASAVQIFAHDAAHALVSPPAGTVLTLTTSPGTAVWQAGLNSGAGGWLPSGSTATYNWPGGQSSFSVNLRMSTVGAVNINLSDNNGKTESAGEDLSIAFVDSALRVTTAAGAPVNIGTQLAGKNSDFGFGAQTLKLQAIRTDTSTGSCAGLIPGQTVTVEMAAARINPTGGPSAVSVQNNASSFVAVGTGAGTAGAYTAVTLSFDAQSLAPLVINYPDAGSIALFARYQLPTPPASTYVSGSSNTFVVRPFAMYTVVTGNPGVNTPSGAVFTWAGTNFSTTVKAVVWQAADDGNNDGIPDSGANLADNTATPNFAYATTLTAAAPYEPSTGTLGALNNGSLAAGAFSAGVASPTNLQYTEVGSFTLTTAVTDYLGDANADVAGLPIVVGRFTPHHFAVVKNTPRFDAACLGATTSFSYIGQSFGYATGFAPTATVTAANALGGTTKNYTGAWRRLSNATLTLATPSGPYAAFAGTLDPLSLPNVASDPAIADLTGASLGLFTLTFSSSGGFRFARTTPVTPFDADIGLSINIIDADNVAYGSNPLTFGAATAGNGIVFNGAGSTPKQMRFGRLTLSNAFGSDRLDLPIPIETQYYTAGGIYKTNAEDICTSISPSNVFLSSGAATGGGVFAAGKGNLKITKPLSAVSIDLCVDLDGTPPSDGSCVAATPTNLPWLQWKWTGATFDKDPRAKATFGLFKSADEFIYLREMF